MTAPDEPPLPASSQPISDLLLAQALEACIEAERDVPGSSADVIARAPIPERAELERLMDTLRALESVAATARPSPRFRVAARKRLLRRIGIDPGIDATPRPIGGARLAALSGTGRRVHSRWITRSVAGLIAVVLATTTTLSVSAGALPGDALYGFKQAQEELSLRLVSNDDLVLAMLRRADARLDETARLLELGRTNDAIETAQRFDAIVERATATYVVTADFSQIAPAQTAELEVMLDEQHERLQNILASAPEPARPDLREALAVTERGRQLVSEPRPATGSVLRRSSRPAGVAAPPAVAEEQPTVVPTQRPTATPSVYVLSLRSDRDAQHVSEPDDEREPPVVAQAGGPAPSRGGDGQENRTRNGDRQDDRSRSSEGQDDRTRGSEGQDDRSRGRTADDGVGDAARNAEARELDDARQHEPPVSARPAEQSRRGSPPVRTARAPVLEDQRGSGDDEAVKRVDTSDVDDDGDDEAVARRGEGSSDDERRGPEAATPSPAVARPAPAAIEEDRGPRTVRQGASEDNLRTVQPQRPSIQRPSTGDEPGPRAVAATAQASRATLTPTPEVRLAGNEQSPNSGRSPSNEASRASSENSGSDSRATDLRGSESRSDERPATDVRNSDLRSTVPTRATTNESIRSGSESR